MLALEEEETALLLEAVESLEAASEVAKLSEEAVALLIDSAVEAVASPEPTLVRASNSSSRVTSPLMSLSISSFVMDAVLSTALSVE